MKNPIQMILGDKKITLIESGRFRLDGGSMFSVVPRVLWEKTNPPDEQNRIEMAAAALLVEDGKERILIETGLGDKFDEKFRARYDVENRTVIDGLAAAGVRPETIDHVINTHLHFDHAGGNTVWQNGEIAPAFQNARYHIQRTEWEWACRPSLRDRASYIADDFLPLEKAGVLALHDGEVEIAPGIALLPTPGHNAGHQSVLIRSGKDAVLCMTDLCPTSSHVPLPYIMSYDLFPLEIIKTKSQIFERAAEEQWTVHFYHDPKVHFGRVAYDEKGRIGLKEVLPAE